MVRFRFRGLFGRQEDIALKASTSVKHVGKGGGGNRTRFRRKALFDLLERARSKGAIFVPLTYVDETVKERIAAIFLKHDVHGLDVGAMVSLAEREISMGIRGTYFFLPPNHPRARGYSFEEQGKAMRAIKTMGHEIGVHIDPYFQFDEKQKPLAEVLSDIIRAFRAEGIILRIGNIHGNSRHKHPDRFGFGTSFDFFEEIARQPDYPSLRDVPPASAEIIRFNRMSLRKYGFTHWGDMPLWSAQLGFVATNFMTDNRLGSSGTVELLVQLETMQSYQIASDQPPGSRNRSRSGRRIFLSGLGSSAAASRRVYHRFPSDDLRAEFEAPELFMPLLMLIHPEFYC